MGPVHVVLSLPLPGSTTHPFLSVDSQFLSEAVFKSSSATCAFLFLMNYYFIRLVVGFMVLDDCAFVVKIQSAQKCKYGP